MNELLLNFDEKVQDINHYFDLVKFLDDKQHIDSFRITGELQATLKANCYLLLYNLIESSVVEGLNAIFANINQQNISFEQLNDNYKQLWLEYKYQLISKSKKENSKTFDKNLPEILDDLSIFKILDYIEYIKLDGNEIKVTSENYRSYVKTLGKNEISGNLDTQKIEEFAKKYGFEAPKRSNGRDLVNIKNFRNKLAHGEKMFSDIGREKTVPELISINVRVVNYLRAFLENINQFINDEKYLKPMS